MHLLLHLLGLDDLSGPWYGFWSGFGSDVSEFALLGAVLGAYRKANCHAKGCWRLGHHPVGPYRVCRKHHPALDDRAPTAAAIADCHKRAES